jgi:aminobenzoyl-glutamate transport protein
MADDSRRAAAPARRGAFTRFLDAVEFLGNLLPHPVTLFALFALAVLLASGLLSWLDFSVADPRPEGAAGRAPDGMIEVVNLLSAAGLRRIVEGFVTNFTGFVPLGVVLVALLGVAVAERSGLFAAVIRKLVMGASREIVTLAIVFAGVLSNAASEMGYVVLVPLGAAIFHSLGRHPLAGLAAAFAGVSGGYSANLVIGTIDPLLAGLTQQSAQLMDPGYTVHPLVNWYFMIASTFVVTLLGWWVTTRIVEPKLGAWDPAGASEELGAATRMEPLSEAERRGLRRAGVAALVTAALIAWTVVPADGVLRNPETGSILHSPFLNGVVAFIFVMFVVPGFVYGRAVGTLRNDRDVIKAMEEGMRTLGLYIVLVFFAAQFVAWFGWSNIGTITAVLGARSLEAIGLTGPLFFLLFIPFCAFINLAIGSASAKWAIMAPIFVPMLMLLGYSPELTQAAYRVGDSVSNVITPMMSYFGLILAMATRYVRNLGLGTLIATMLPYTIVFMIGWTAFFYLYVFVVGLPLGPATPLYWPAS